MPYTKGRMLNDGGEGYIYEVLENPKLLLKMYKDKDSAGSPIVTPDLHSKLAYMKNNPPENLVQKGILAWPIDLVESEQGKLIGFVMPKVDLDEHLKRVYSYRHPGLEASEYALFPSVKSRLSIAINLCSALHELHTKGYVIGDFNHANIGVNYGTGQIYFMDCDSFHITDDNNIVHRTSVIMSGYLAPEIIKHCNDERSKGRPYNLDKVALPTFTRESDLFCLAIHIFKLLMNGVDPFLGVKHDATGSQAAPFVGNEAIERNTYVFRPGNKPSAVFCPPAESLPPEILALFNKAFIEGRTEPLTRPTETDWYNALNRYLTNELIQCRQTAKHQYYRSLPECPYCLADEEHWVAQGGDPHGVPHGVPHKKKKADADKDKSDKNKNEEEKYAPNSTGRNFAAILVCIAFAVGILGLSLNGFDGYKQYTATVEYDPNGGIVPQTEVLNDQNYPIDHGTVEIDFPSTAPFAYEYTFLGWRLDNDAANPLIYREEKFTQDTGKINSDITLTYYAQWSDIPNQGGSVWVEQETDYAFVPDTSGAWTLKASDNGDNEDTPLIELYDGFGNWIMEAEAIQGTAYDGTHFDVITSNLEAGTTYTIHAEHGNYTLTVSPYGYIHDVAWDWGNTQVDFGSWLISPLILSTTITNCLSFNLVYELSEVQGGDIYGNVAIYVKKVNSGWARAGTIYVPDANQVSTTVDFTTPTSFTEISCVPLRTTSSSITQWYDPFGFIIAR